ncbi:MAG: TIGR00730 family Rossman fold protein [Bacteroidota bacterium]
MTSISIFCGSSPGFDPVYIKQAQELGRALAERGSRIIFGGGKVGLMGAVANAAMEAGGEVIGVIPQFMMPREVAHEGLTELIVTESMTDRKLKMHDLSDAVITLAGGFGTMEELFEVLTWDQLKLISKPIGILNTNRYYDPLIEMMDKMVGIGFLRPDNRNQLCVSEDINGLLVEMEDWNKANIPS